MQCVLERATARHICIRMYSHVCINRCRAVARSNTCNQVSSYVAMLCYATRNIIFLSSAVCVYLYGRTVFVRWADLALRCAAGVRCLSILAGQRNERTQAYVA